MSVAALLGSEVIEPACFFPCPAFCPGCPCSVLPVKLCTFPILLSLVFLDEDVGLWHVRLNVRQWLRQPYYLNLWKVTAIWWAHRGFCLNIQSSQYLILKGPVLASRIWEWNIEKENLEPWSMIWSIVSVEFGINKCKNTPASPPGVHCSHNRGARQPLAVATLLLQLVAVGIIVLSFCWCQLICCTR